MLRGRGRPHDGRHTPLAPGDAGLTLVEVVIAMAVIVMAAAMAVPATAEVIDANRARHAASVMAAKFRLARLQAASATRSVALVFDPNGTGWDIRLCADGNGNGVRRADLTAGVDSCVEGPYDVSHLVPGMTIGVDPRLPGPDGEPGSGDPVRFGVSDLLSFSPAGTCTAGTLFLRSPNGTQYAVRISNVTARTRVLRWEPGPGRWVTV